MLSVVPLLRGRYWGDDIQSSLPERMLLRMELHYYSTVSKILRILFDELQFLEAAAPSACSFSR
jgi:hypothetical protein